MSVSSLCEQWGRLQVGNEFFLEGRNTHHSVVFHLKIFNCVLVCVEYVFYRIQKRMLNAVGLSCLMSVLGTEIASSEAQFMFLTSEPALSTSC